MVCPGDLEGVRGEIKGAGGSVIVFRAGPLGIRVFFSTKYVYFTHKIRVRVNINRNPPPNTDRAVGVT